MDSTVNNSSQIDGIITTELRQISDERGAVLHMLRCDALGFVRFGECYFSEVLPGAIKAWKRHRVQSQNLAVPVGRIRLVIYDDRESSTTQGNFQVLELGRPDAYLRVLIPPGLWYGFSCISATPALLANCADLPHDPAESELRPVNDSSLPYAWVTGDKGSISS
ncbi:dTDP-4-dehydrorhamnose 3,5-epimerase family protein [Paracoccaceae bacterium]|nr:dTDP-4-dehydrorhamnose 3,5-epimerase family protein [Paracoccaceae bacterium]